MKALSPRTQVGLIAVGYAGVVLLTAVLLWGRHITALQDPVSASGGMFAFGDLLLAMFIGCLFMVPTLFSIWVLSRSREFYGRYSKVVLILSLTAPICLGMSVLGGDRLGQFVGYIALYRMMAWPFVFAAMLFSRWLAKSDFSKRLISYSLFIEGLTVVAAVALLIRG